MMIDLVGVVGKKMGGRKNGGFVWSFVVVVVFSSVLHQCSGIRWLAIGNDLRERTVNKRTVRTPFYQQQQHYQQQQQYQETYQSPLPQQYLQQQPQQFQQQYSKPQQYQQTYQQQPQQQQLKQQHQHQINYQQQQPKYINPQINNYENRYTRENDKLKKYQQQNLKQQQHTQQNNNHYLNFQKPNSKTPKLKRRQRLQARKKYQRQRKQKIQQQQRRYNNKNNNKTNNNQHNNNNPKKPLRSALELSWNSSAVCRDRRHVRGLNSQQRSICGHNIDLMPGVILSAKQTIDACQRLFAEKRWNCQSINKAPKFLPDLTGGSREQAFVYSLASSSLAHGIAKTCSSGQTSKCGCAPIPQETPNGDFQWGGCGDDIRFGVGFSKVFMESGEIGRKRRAINVHNAAVGRKILLESVGEVCKCHGVSGSCSLKTCFKSLPPLTTIASTLHKRYLGAVGVASEEDNHPPFITNPRKSGRSLSKRLVNNDRLIFSSISPDYCLPDSDLGSLGTTGRECQKDSSKSSGCKSMCCGRGHTSEMLEETFKCQCKYHWCCEVVCKVCRKKVMVNKCR